MGAELRPAVGIARRDEVLAFIIDRISVSGISPTYEEIGRGVNPCICKSRVAQLVNQLIKRGVISREPGAQRTITIRDPERCRAMIDRALQARGWWHAEPLGELQAPNPVTPAPCTSEQLPLLPPFEHLPDED